MHELQTCTRDESCKSNFLHEIPNLSLVGSTASVSRELVKDHVCLIDRRQHYSATEEHGEL